MITEDQYNCRFAEFGKAFPVHHIQQMEKMAMAAFAHNPIAEMFAHINPIAVLGPLQAMLLQAAQRQVEELCQETFTQALRPTGELARRIEQYLRSLNTKPAIDVLTDSLDRLAQ